jgi:hypothetical protein
MFTLHISKILQKKSDLKHFLSLNQPEWYVTLFSHKHRANLARSQRRWRNAKWRGIHLLTEFRATLHVSNLLTFLSINATISLTDISFNDMIKEEANGSEEFHGK